MGLCIDRCITVEMRRIKYELLLEDGQPKIIDGFIRDDPSLQRLYPAQLSIEMNPLKATIVEVGLLRSRSIIGAKLSDIKHLTG